MGQVHMCFLYYIFTVTVGGVTDWMSWLIVWVMRCDLMAPYRYIQPTVWRCNQACAQANLLGQCATTSTCTCNGLSSSPTKLCRTTRIRNLYTSSLAWSFLRDPASLHGYFIDLCSPIHLCRLVWDIQIECRLPSHLTLITIGICTLPFSTG